MNAYKRKGLGMYFKFACSVLWLCGFMLLWCWWPNAGLVLWCCAIGVLCHLRNYCFVVCGPVCAVYLFGGRCIHVKGNRFRLGKICGLRRSGADQSRIIERVVHGPTGTLVGTR